MTEQAMVTYEEGEYGCRAILHGPWSNSLAQKLAKTKCVELEINHAKGWSGTDVGFVTTLPDLKALKIIDFNISSVAPIHSLGQLRLLELITYCGTSINFDAFPHLVDCGIEWRAGSDTLFRRGTLRRLFINCYDGSSTEVFSTLENLEELAILNSPIKSLSGLRNLNKLEKLRLANLKKLLSLDGMEVLTNLEELELHTCRHVDSIEALRHLRKLKTLHLLNMGKIASLRPLDALDTLEAVVFYESTNIVDGDLTPLIRQPKLRNVSFQNRKHYTHKCEDFPREVPR